MTRAASRFLDEIMGRKGNDAVWDSFDSFSQTAAKGLSETDEQTIDHYAAEYDEDNVVACEEALAGIRAYVADQSKSRA